MYTSLTIRCCGRPVCFLLFRTLQSSQELYALCVSAYQKRLAGYVATDTKDGLSINWITKRIKLWFFRLWVSCLCGVKLITKTKNQLLRCLVRYSRSVSRSRKLEMRAEQASKRACWWRRMLVSCIPQATVWVVGDSTQQKIPYIRWLIPGSQCRDFWFKITPHNEPILTCCSTHFDYLDTVIYK